MRTLVPLLVLAGALVGCSDTAPVGKPILPPMDQRSPEDQIKAIDSSPLPPQQKAREIARIKQEAGQKGKP